MVETKGVHLKASEDTEYKRSAFDICGEHARKADWAEFVPAMRGKVVCFEAPPPPVTWLPSWGPTGKAPGDWTTGSVGQRRHQPENRCPTTLNRSDSR